MQVILQFCLIAILLEEVFSTVYYNNYQCVHPKMDDLTIPDDNPRIKGEKNNTSDKWYTHINWLDNPAGDLTLSYTSHWSADATEGVWPVKTSDTISVYDEGEIEKFDWAKLTRTILGLNHPHVKIPGKVRVSQNLFPENKCFWINPDQPYYDEYNYRISLKVTDDDGYVFLTGNIRIPPK